MKNRQINCKKSEREFNLASLQLTLLHRRKRCQLVPSYHPLCGLLNLTAMSWKLLCHQWRPQRPAKSCWIEKETGWKKLVGWQAVLVTTRSRLSGIQSIHDLLCINNTQGRCLHRASSWWRKGHADVSGDKWAETLTLRDIVTPFNLHDIWRPTCFPLTLFTNPHLMSAVLKTSLLSVVLGNATLTPTWGNMVGRRKCYGTA